MTRECMLCGAEIDIETETHQVVKVEKPGEENTPTNLLQTNYLCMLCSVKFDEWLKAKKAAN